MVAGSKKQRGFFYELGAFVSLLRLKFLESFYSAHIPVRKLHDKAYQKGGVYKKWSDKKYSHTVHKATLTAFIISFTIFTLGQSLFPNFFRPKNDAQAAGPFSYTWTSQADFQSATTNSNVDFTTSAGSVRLSGSTFTPQGDGHDGTVTITGNANINVDALRTGRTVADGWVSRVSSLTANTATLVTSPPAGTFNNAGEQDEVVVISVKGSPSTNVGKYEFLKVQSVSSNVVTFTSNKQNNYGEGANDTNVGTTQHVIIQRIPNYQNVTINSGQSLTASNWDGTKGGLLFFRVSGTLVNNGTITTTAKGYRGGASATTQSGNSQSGETFSGGLAGSGGSGFGGTTTGIAGPGGGGGAGAYDATTFSGAAGAVGGSGGAGGTAHNGYNQTAYGGAGGAGGYGSVGNGGINAYATQGGSGSGTSGGAGTTSVPGTKGGNGGGGGTYGDSTTLDQQVFFGSGGGAGGQALKSSCGFAGGAGGYGGGVIGIYANEITNSGTIESKGGDGVAGTTGASCKSGDGGSGAGGSIIIQAISLTNSSQIRATGGALAGGGRTYLKYGTKSGNAIAPNLSEIYAAPFLQPGTLGSVGSSVGLRTTLDTSKRYNWTSISSLFDGDVNSAGMQPLQASQGVKFLLRTSSNGSTWTIYGRDGNTVTDGAINTAWSNNYFGQVSGGSLYTTPAQIIPSTPYAEILVRIESSGSNTPGLDEVTLSYDSLEAPQHADIYLRKTDVTPLNTMYGSAVMNSTYGGLAYTNETSVKFYAYNLTCAGCGTSTNIRPEVQIAPLSDTSFSSPTTAVASPGSNNVTFSNLTPGTSYHARVRAIDDQGRASDWVPYANNAESQADFTVEQDVPSGTVSINSGAAYANSQNVTLAVTATDNGAVQSSQTASQVDMRFSGDGNTWSNWEDYAAAKSWDLGTGEGVKTVYAQFKDNAGNVGGTTTHTTSAQFSGAVNNVQKTNDELKLTSYSNIIYPGIGGGGWNEDTYGAGWYNQVGSWSDPNATKVRANLFISGTDIHYDIKVPSANGVVWSGTDGDPTQWFSGNSISIWESCAPWCTWGSYGISSIEFANDQYPESGTYVSNTVDFGPNGSVTRLSWEDIQTLDDSYVAFQIASKEIDSGWQDQDYIGPDGTTSSFYTDLDQNVSTHHSKKRFLRYKAFLHSNTARTQTPIVGSITLNSATADTITLDTQAPTGTVTINTNNPQYTNNKAVTLYLDPTNPEPGESGVKEFQLSNDGVTWGTAYNPTTGTYSGTWQTWNESYRGSGSGYSWNLIKGVSDAGTDGSRTVYIKYRDNAGNIGGDVGGWIYQGRAGSSLEGKLVYYQNNGSLQWKTSNTACNSPQCEIGLDAAYLSYPSLVANSQINFSEYPAQNSCDAIGGRLPYYNELNELKDNRSLYGNNFGSTPYWTATQLGPGGGYAYVINFGLFAFNQEKIATNSVRCIKDTNVAISDTISLDTVAPSASAVSNITANPNNTGNQTVTWGGFADASPSSNFQKYVVQRKPNGGAYADIKTEATQGTLTYSDNTNLSEGTYYYRVVAYDNAGNTTISTDSVVLTIDKTVPTGTVSIGGSNVQGNFAKSSLITLTLDASDAGGSNLASYELSNDGNTWSPVTSISGATYSNNAVSWDLNDTRYGGVVADGSKNVYVRYKDAAGNITTIRPMDEAGVISTWHLEDLNDSTGSNNLSTNGTPSLNQGRFGNAYLFNGTDQFLSKDSGVVGVGGANQFTLEAWVKSGVRKSDTQMIVAVGDDYGYRPSMSLYDGSITFQVGNGTVDGVGGLRRAWTSSGSVPADGNWYYLVGTYSAGAIKIYINGEEAPVSAEGSFAGNIPAITTYLRVGSAYRTFGGPNVYHFNGMIDDVRLSNTARAGAEIQNYYNFLSTSISLDTQAPSAFTLTGPANGTWSQTDNNPTFAWNASTDANFDHYELWIDGAKNGADIPLGQNSRTAASPLSQNNHPWSVKAVDAAGNVTQSTGDPWTYGYDTLAPSSLLDGGFALSVTDNDPDRILVTWNDYADDSGAGSPAASYIIERLKTAFLSGPYTETSTNWQELEGDSSSGYLSRSIAAGQPHQIIDSQPGDIDAATNYIYRIRVVDAAGNTSNYQVSSNWHKVGLTDDQTPPTYPTTVKAAACDGTGGNIPDTTTPRCSNSNLKGYEIALTWTPSVDNGVGVVGYLVYRRAETDGQNTSDFTLVGYVHAPTPEVPVFYDNDTNVLASYTEDILGQTVTMKPAGNNGMRLNDSTDYYYRIVGVDAKNNRYADIISRSNPNTPPVTVTQVNWAATQTPDVTAPSWYNVNGNVYTPTTNAGIQATAAGLDGIADDSDPKQRVNLTWSSALDRKNLTRTPIGNGSGVTSYTLMWAKGDAGGPTEGYHEITGLTGTNYSQARLEPKPAYYYYKLVAKDGATPILSSPESDVISVQTLSNDYPNTPQEVRVNAIKGDPSPANTRVGKDLTVSFIGSRIKNAGNFVTGYEIYRSTNPNANWSSLTPIKTIPDNLNSGGSLNIPGDTWDSGDNACASATVPNTEPPVSVHKRCFTDTVPTDSTTYYYKIRTVATNPDLGGTIYSSLTGFDTESHNVGWDTVPDATRPTFTTGSLEVKVRDTHPNDVELRNIVTWKMLAGAQIPTRNGVSDFARYEVWREIYNPNTDALLEETKVADKTSINENYFTDNIDLTTMVGAFYIKDCKIKYYIKVVDNAGTDFKYADNSIINNQSNYSNKEYASDSIIPSKAKPSLTSSVALSNVSVASATVTWTTDQDADSIVQFRPMGSEGEWTIDGQVEKSLNHTVKLKGLAPNTTYEYQIISRNYLGNNLENIGTLPILKTTGFNIAFDKAVTTTTTAEVSWTTNLDAASAFVEYQLQQQPGDPSHSGGATVTKESLDTNPRSHKVVIQGLRSNRTYSFKIKSISTDDFLAEYPEKNRDTFRTRSFDTTQFTLAPSSSNVAERNITATTALIAWQTAAPTTSWVDYSTKSGVYDVSAGDNNLNTQHAVQLEGLVPGTKYYYRVRVKDASEVEYTSMEYFFTAVLKPKVSNLQIKDLTPYSVKIFWETNVETETILNWGKTAGYGEKKGKNEMTKIHELVVENLDDNTEYHYQILAKDEAGNEVADEDKIIRTPLDKEGPKITDVKTDLLPMGAEDTTSTIIISWKTNKPASTQVQYDEGLIGQKLSNMTTEDKTLNNSHTVIVRDLNPATTYRFRMVSTDKRGNTSTSNDYNFVTPSKEKSILQLIVKSLEDTFSWVKNIGGFFRGLGKKTS